MFGMARDAGNAGVTMRGNNAGGEALGLMAATQFAFIFSRFAMLTPIAWQEVHEPPSVFLAIAGVSAKVLLVCAVESGWEWKALLYAKARPRKRSTTSEPKKMPNGREPNLWSVPIEIDLTDAWRSSCAGATGGRFSRVRLSQNTLSEFGPRMSARSAFRCICLVSIASCIARSYDGLHFAHTVGNLKHTVTLSASSACRPAGSRGHLEFVCRRSAPQLH